MLSDHSTLKNAARNSLARADYDPKKLILIFTGSTLLLSALLIVIDYLLEQSISNAVGLGGLGTRAMLTTAQSVLQLAQVVILPFWQMGYLYAALKIARGETAAPDSLLQGFRRFGSALRLQILMGVILFGLIIVCSYAASYLFMLTHWGKGIMAELVPLLEDPALLENTEALEELLYGMLSNQILPVLLIFGAVFLAILVPVFFRMRFAHYVIMDGEQSATAALRTSRRITKGNCKDLLKLDLSFWWFYILDVLLTTLCYGDVLLKQIGVSLPWNPAVSYFLFFGLYLIGQLALYCTCRNQVEVTYAHAYCELNPQTEE